MWALAPNLVSWCAPVSVANQNSEWRLSQLGRRVWQIEDGLPHNYVTAIAADEKGYLLLGTQSGMIRFDGMRFTPPGSKLEERFGSLWIYALLKASDGTLWVGSYQSGLYAIREGKVESWTGADLSGDGSVFSLLEDHSHRIWAVASNALIRFDAGHLRTIQRGTNVDGFSWQSITEDDDGAIWFAAAEGLYRVTGEQVRRLQVADARGLPVTIYYSSRRRQLYLGTTTGLYLLKCGNDVCESTPVADVRGPVVGVRVTSDNVLWVATWGNGVFRSNQSGMEQFSTPEGLADDFVRVLSEDNEHNLWAGTRSGGLTRFRKTPLKPFGIAEGLGGNYASAVLDDGAGGLWLGTWRSGLFHWRNGVMTPQPLPEPSLGTLISAVALDSANNLWVGTFHGLWRFRNGSKVAERVPIPNGDGNVMSILPARDGTFWLAKSGGGLTGFASGDPRTSRPMVLLPGDTVTGMLEDGEGRIWIGARSGVWRMNAPPDRRIERLQAGSVTALCRDSRGRIWVAMDGGKIQIFTAGGPTLIRFTSLPAPQVYLIADDARSHIWFGTGRGLSRASMRDVEDFLAGHRGRVELSVYGIPEGMRTIECRLRAQPASCLRKDGSIWIPTAKGFVEIEPATGADLPPPRPWIEEIRVDGKAVSRNGPVRLSPGTHELAVDFTAIRLGCAERVQFRYRLQGIDQDWVEAGGERMARYSNLRPGRFELLVSARDLTGQWSEAIATPVIEQAPFVYQTLWFRGLMAATIAGMILVLYLFRVRAVRRRYAAVLEERNRIAREWHDTLLGGLSAASWQLEVTLEQCRQISAFTTIQRALGMVRYCREEARRAIGDLRHEHVEGLSLTDSLQQAIRQLTDSTAVHSRLEVDGKVPSCSSELNSDLLRICQEAVANALRHARATEIVVRLSCGHGKISLSVQDDGIGMDKAWIDHPPHGHYGLLGMRERTRRFGGNLILASEPGRGTQVTAVVPVKS
jgi:signal transduction histidine kinase/ligand-binding sensor domain-containing protein